MDGFIGHSSFGAVSDGTADILIGGRNATVPVHGRVALVDGYCPGASCRVGLDFALRADGFVVGDGITNDHFEAISVAGSSVPGGAAMDGFGQATFLNGEVFVTARATGIRTIAGIEAGRETDALYFPNTTPVELSVDWASGTFRIRGDFDVPAEDPHSAPAVSVRLDARGVIENVPPVAVATGPVNLECSGSSGAVVDLDASGSSDADGNLIAFVWRRGTDGSGAVIGTQAIVATTQTVGTQTYLVTAIDTLTQLSTATVDVSVRDTTGPVFTAIEPSAACIWPPDHRYVRFELGADLVATATDTCSGPASVRVVGVTSDQPDDATDGGDGATTNDVLFGPRGFCVRSERLGAGPAGRTYTVRLAATDAHGNETIRDVTVLVPHDQGDHCPTLDPIRFVADADAATACDFAALLPVSSAPIPMAGSGSSVRADAGLADGGRPTGSGTGCSVSSRAAGPVPAFAWAALLGLAWLRRRRQ
jgi:MYXO-CTERM domain-containing protein